MPKSGTPSSRPQGSERARVLTKAVLRAASIMELGQDQFALILGMSADTVERMQQGKWLLTEGSRPWARATLLVRLFVALDSMTADNRTMLRAWLTGQNTELGDAPINLIRQEDGLARVTGHVEGYLQAM